MRIWFARCNGETAHNQPGSRLYVEGEEPRFPLREFNYKSECIIGSFARIGMPGAGNLRLPSWQQTARVAYPTISDEHLQNLADFASICVGDVMMIPAYRDKGDVRIGVVVGPPSDRCPTFDGIHAYHYYYDTKQRDWYENAHRVSVQWSPKFATLSCLGRVWLKMFGQVVKGSDEVVKAATERGLDVGQVKE